MKKTPMSQSLLHQVTYSDKPKVYIYGVERRVSQSLLHQVTYSDSLLQEL